MSKRWRVTDEYLGTEAAARFSDLDQVFAAVGTLVSADPISRTSRLALPGGTYYLKLYHAAGKRLRRYFGRSKISKEWRNLLTLRNLGVPGAGIVAYGEERRFGLFQRGALVTEEIASAVNLSALGALHPELFADGQWMRSVLRQLAEMTRRMHSAGFTHGDLHWRNVLVTTRGPPKVYLIDCPAGRRWPRPLLRARVVRDLASLDVNALDALRTTQRLYFFLRYRGARILSAVDKRMIWSILAYNRDKSRNRVSPRPRS